MANNLITATASTYSGTTSVGNVDVVTLDKAYALVEITQRTENNTGALWVTLDGGANNERTITPTVGGAGSRYVGPGGSRVLEDDTNAQGAPKTVARITAAAAVDYIVIGHVAL